MEDKFGKARKSIEDVRQMLKRIGEEKRQKKKKETEEEEAKASPVVGVDCNLGLEVISEEDEVTGESEMGDGSSWASGSCAS